MTKEEYEDFVLRYKGCGACFPMYHTLSRFEKMWFTAIQKDVAELEKENTELKERHAEILEAFASASSGDDFEMAESAREIMEILNIPCYRHGKVVSKLTKAKGLLKKIEKIVYSGENEIKRLSQIVDILAEAEQFLNSEVEK